MALHELGWRHDKLLEILHSYVMKMNNKLNTYNISLLLSAYAALAPDNMKFLADLGPELHDRLAMAVSSETFRLDPSKPMKYSVEELTPDLTSYANLWLAITCFGVKAPVNTTGASEESTDY